MRSGHPLSRVGGVGKPLGTRRECRPRKRGTHKQGTSRDLDALYCRGITACGSGWGPGSLGAVNLLNRWAVCGLKSLTGNNKRLGNVGLHSPCLKRGPCPCRALKMPPAGAPWPLKGSAWAPGLCAPDSAGGSATLTDLGVILGLISDHCQFAPQWKGGCVGS